MRQIGKVDIKIEVDLDMWKPVKKIRQVLCRGLWNISEWSGIGLGCFAPQVFYYMVGAQKKKRIDY